MILFYDVLVLITEPQVDDLKCYTMASDSGAQLFAITTPVNYVLTTITTDPKTIIICGIIDKVSL